MSLHKGLAQSADLLANKIIENLDQNTRPGGYPTGKDRSGRGYKKIQDTVEIGTVQDSGQGNLSIAITLGGEKAPYARAYEFGTEEYTIPVGSKGFLAWPVGQYPNRWAQYSGNLNEGEFFITKKPVRHPAIQAQPYIQPAIEAVSDQIRQIIGQEFKAEIMAGRQKVTIIKA